MLLTIAITWFIALALLLAFELARVNVIQRRKNSRATSALLAYIGRL